MRAVVCAVVCAVYQGCGQAQYCSVECEKAGWATTHRTRCPAVLFARLVKKAAALQVLQMSRVDLRVVAITSANLRCLVLTHTAIHTLRLNCPSLRYHDTTHDTRHTTHDTTHAHAHDTHDTR